MPQPRRQNQKKQQGKKGPPPLTAPLDPREARKMANAEARAEYGPTLRGARQMKKGSVERQKNIGEWFQGLQNQIGQSAAQTDASYGQANAALLAHMNAAQQAAAATQGQIAQSNMDMTALTGADPSLTAPSLQEGAAAANQRNIAGAALAAPIAQAGASQAAYLRNTGINARREGIDQKLGEAKRRDKIGEDITSLQKEEAQKRIGNFRGIRAEEGDREIQRRAFPEAQADRQLQREEGDANRNIDWYNAKTGRQNAQQGGEDGGRTPTQIRNDRRDYKNAYTTAQTLYQSAKKPPQTDKEWAAYIVLVANETGVPAQVVKKAVNRLRKQIQQKSQNQGRHDGGAGRSPGLNVG